MKASTNEQLVFPFQRLCPFDPPREYERLRTEHPVTRVTLDDGRTAWLLSRSEDVRAVLADSRVSVQPRLPGGDDVDPRPGWFIGMDPPKHDVLRRMLTRDFMIRRLEAMRPGIQRIVDELIDVILNGPTPVDLVEAFAYPLPSLVICQLLGVPYEDHDFFQSRTRIMATRASTVEERQAAVMDLVRYLNELVRKKDEQLGEDLISRLIVEQVRTGTLTHEELAGMATVLLGAGHETTGNMTAIGMLTLLQHPEQLAELRSDPALVLPAVDELLRYLSIIETASRTATQDLEVGGQIIRAGEGIIFGLASANRDDEVFPEPNGLDIHRPAHDHAAFGVGIHYCLGAPLARIELQIAFSTLARRIPTLRLAVPLEEIAFKHNMAAYGVHELPVTW